MPALPPHQITHVVIHIYCVFCYFDLCGSWLRNKLMYRCERHGYESVPNVQFKLGKFVGAFKECDLPLEVTITVLRKSKQVRASFSLPVHA